MKLLAVAIGVATLGLAAAQASSPATVPGLVYTPGYGNSIVTRYDPLTLARSGPRIRLGGNASSWSWSPGRRYLAIASYPQRLTILDAADLRVVARIRLGSGGGVVRAVTWTRRDRVVALVETPRGVLLSAVDTVAGRVDGRALIPRTLALAFARVPGGLVFLLSSRGRLEPARLATVDADGFVRTTTIGQVRAGFVRRASGQVEHQTPGLAVDPVGRKAYVIGGDRVFPVDLRTLAVTDRGPLRTLAKVVSGATRSAAWLGEGLLAVSGTNWDREGGNTPAGLRIVDVRSWRSRVLDRDASSFTFAGGRLLVERASSRRELTLLAYSPDARELYRLELKGSTWLKKQTRIGYACRDAFLREVVDLAKGRTLRTAFPVGTRCPTLLVDDSRG